MRDEDVTELFPWAGSAIAKKAEEASSRAAWARWVADAARGGGAVLVPEAGFHAHADSMHLYEMSCYSPLAELDHEDGEGPCVMDWWDRADPTVKPFVEVATKDNPVAAYLHALGPERAACLPGWLGDTLLTAAEVRHRLPAVESALTLRAAEKRAALDRIAAWSSDMNAEEMLDGPLRVWRETAAAGLGLLSSRIWI